MLKEMTDLSQTVFVRSTDESFKRTNMHTKSALIPDTPIDIVAIGIVRSLHLRRAYNNCSAFHADFTCALANVFDSNL